MFEFIFGCRKATKCKKLIRNVQCRLKLLKNRRCSIVRLLREDVCQLLKHGDFQSVFDRAEQIYKHECIVAVYDLLNEFCDFIMINKSYIFRQKFCPNDINEAISTLIFASGRCGDLPELRGIRKLFGEHYGQQFASVALDLLPGHLVNRQVKENLSIISVDLDVKYKLVDEIARSCHQSEALALEYIYELHLQQERKNDDFCPNNEICRKPQKQDTKILHVNISTESKSFQELPEKKSPEISKSYNIQLDYPLEHSEGNNDKENGSSSDDLSYEPEEVIYLDEIEEYQSPMNNDDKSEDQRVFKFKSFGTPTRGKYEGGYYSDIEYDEEQYNQYGKKKSRKTGEKRSRKRTSFLEDGKSYFGGAKLDRLCTVKFGNEFVQGKFVCFKDETDQVINHSYSDREKEEQIEERVCYTTTSDDQLSKMHAENLDSTNASMCSCSTGISPSQAKETRPPYLRASTMPLNRPKDSWTDINITRVNSFPFEQPNHFSCLSPHVHPKLPDYDDLAAKFMALKNVNLQSSRAISTSSKFY